MKNEKWINIAKCVAILGVIADHTYGILHLTIPLEHGSLYSVSLFIFLMGITTAWSYGQSMEPLYRKMLSRIKRIWIPYAFAVFVYYAVIFKRFDLLPYLQFLVGFHISGPMYYVFLYIQLLVISPILFYFIHTSKNSRYGWLKILAGAAFLFWTGCITDKYTNMLDVGFAGGKLFGGSFVFVFFMGLLAGAWYEKILALTENRTARILAAVISCILAAGSFYFMEKYRILVNYEDSLLGKRNPPGIMIIWYSLSIAAAVFFVVKLVESVKILSPVLDFLDFLGRHTLYIFLYHRLFLDYLIPQMVIPVWPRRVIYLAVMIAAPVLMEYIANYIGNYVKKCYHDLGKSFRS